MDKTNAPEQPAWATLLTTVIFGVVTVIVALRPLVQETHTSQLNPFEHILQDVPPLSPLPTLWMNLIMLVCFGVTMTARVSGWLPPRRTGLTVGYLVVVVAASLSCTLASDQRLALNATLDWLTLPLLTITLAQIVVERWQWRVLLCVVVASGCAAAAESFDQVLVGIPDTIEMYEQDKQAMWAGKNVPEDSYQIALFEKRLYGGAAKGFFALSNVAGNYFILIVMLAVGAAVAAWKSNRTQALAAAIPAIAVLIALFMTKSLGARLGIVIAAALCVTFYWLHGTIAKHRRRSYVIGWICVIGGAAATLQAVRLDLIPSGSLIYRWWYLETTAHMVADHPGGVGSKQYDRYYPRYKEIKSPEEIQNPHNFLAHAAAEWGVLGLCGVIIMLVQGSWTLSMTTRQPDTHTREAAMRHIVAWGVIISLAVWILRIVIVGSQNANFILATNAYPIMGWLIGYGCCMIIERINPQQLSTVCALGLIASLIHNLISFGLFVPGCATTFFALLGLCYALRNDVVEPTERRSPWRCPWPYGTALVLVAVLWLVITPVRRCHDTLTAARAIYAHNPQQAAQLYWLAGTLDVLDPTPAYEWVKHVPYLDREGNTAAWISDSGYVPTHISTAIQRDPQRVSLYRLAAALSVAGWQHGTQDPRFLDNASQHYDHVLTLYPTQPDDHLKMAEIQSMIYEQSGSAAARHRAVEAYLTALSLNAARDENEIRRFSSGQIADIEGAITKLHATSSP